MVIDQLIALLGYELDPQSEQEKEKFRKGLDDLSEGLVNVATLAAGAATAIGGYVATITASSVATARSTDALGKWAATADESFEFVQRLAFGAEQFGGSLETVQSAIDTLQEARRGLARGEGDFRLFGELGVNLGADTESVIAQLADRFESLSVNRAQDLGRQLGLDRNFIALLQSGNANIQQLGDQLDSVGGILSEELRQGSAEFNDNLNLMNKLIDGIRARVAQSFLPVLSDLITRVTEWSQANSELIDEQLTTFLEFALELISSLVSILVDVISGISELVDFLGGARNAVVALTIAFVSLKAAGLAASLGLISGFGAVGTAGLAANIKVLSGFLLVAGAVAALLAIVQDLWLFYTDPTADTATRAINESINDLIANSETLQGIVDSIFGAFESTLEVLNQIGEALGNLTFDIVEEIRRDGIGGTVVNRLTDAATTTDEDSGIFRRSVSAFNNFISPAVQGGLDAVLGSPGSVNQSTVDATITVQSPDQVEPAVRGVTGGVIDSAQRSGADARTTIEQ